MAYKIGDKVRLTKLLGFDKEMGYKVGQVIEAHKIHNDYDVEDEKGRCFTSDQIELVKKEPPKLKKGDKVLVTGTEKTEKAYSRNKRMAEEGDLIEVVAVRHSHDKNMVDARFNGDVYTYHIDDLELIVTDSDVDRKIQKRKERLKEIETEIRKLAEEENRLEVEIDTLELAKTLD